MSLRLCPEQDALFLDIDGTLLDIAPTPDAVAVPQSLIDDLARLQAKLGGALALVSGRCLKDIDTLFSPLRLPVAGAHGAEWRIEQEREAREPIPETLRRNIRGAFKVYPSLIIEDKIYSMAVHYRQNPDMADTIYGILQQFLSESKQPLKIMSGKMVFEMVYPWHNKGAAIERFMTHSPFAGRRPVFLGDDETDVFAINACQRLGGIGKRVETGDPVFSSPAMVRSWIESNSRP